MSDDKLIQRFIEHEGNKKYAYQDSLGYWSIGIGRCIDIRSGHGLSEEERMYLLQNDIKECRQDLCMYPFYKFQDTVRKDVLVELRFSLGLPKLLKFKNMLAAFQAKDYKKASYELENSLWAKQVQSDRVKDLQYRIEHGSYAP